MTNKDLQMGTIWDKSSVVHLQLARGCVLLMESGMTVACWTEVWVSCCHAGGNRICCVPLGQACYKGGKYRGGERGRKDQI